jgi:hypothetical protein
MRTTLEIDDDVLLAVRERALRQSSSIGRVISELARSALQAPTGVGEPVVRYGFAPKAAGERVVSNVLIDRLRAELGD